MAGALVTTKSPGRPIWIANLIQYKKEGFKPDPRHHRGSHPPMEEGGGPYNGVAWLPPESPAILSIPSLALNEGGLGAKSPKARKSPTISRSVSEKYVANFPARGAQIRAATVPWPRSLTTPSYIGSRRRCSGFRAFGFPLKTNEVTCGRTSSKWRKLKNRFL